MGRRVAESRQRLTVVPQAVWELPLSRAEREKVIDPLRYVKDPRV